MEGRINLVSCVIKSSSSNGIVKDKWWFTPACTPNGIFVNHLNTIIEVSIYQNDYKAITVLENTAVEIAQRIDELSK